MKKGTLKEFVEKARRIHGNKYDYSKSIYTGSKNLIIIHCNEHGDFQQIPNSHLNGRGCPFCGVEKKKSLIRGVAVNDTFISKTDPAFKCWLEILRRCYPKTEKEKVVHRSYSGCKVCDDWLKFSNFWSWYQNNYNEGYSIDKDLLTNNKGNLYSPSTCCFLPKEINNALQCEHIRARKDGCKPFYNKSKHKFEAKLNIKGKTVVIGSFDKEEDAIKAYIERKEEYLEQLASEYYNNKKISYFIYINLLNFKVHYGNY